MLTITAVTQAAAAQEVGQVAEMAGGQADPVEGGQEAEVLVEAADLAAVEEGVAAPAEAGDPAVAVAAVTLAEAAVVPGKRDENDLFFHFYVTPAGWQSGNSSRWFPSPIALSGAVSGFCADAYGVGLDADVGHHYWAS